MISISGDEMGIRIPRMEMMIDFFPSSFYKMQLKVIFGTWITLF